jgi:hypothetical protein
MKVIWKFLDLKCMRYEFSVIFVLGNSIKFLKMILGENFIWITCSHLGQWNGLHRWVLRLVLPSLMVLSWSIPHYQYINLGSGTSPFSVYQANNDNNLQSSKTLETYQRDISWYFIYIARSKPKKVKKKVQLLSLCGPRLLNLA